MSDDASPHGLPALVLTEDPERVVYGRAETLAWLSHQLEFCEAVADVTDSVADALAGMLNTGAIPVELLDATRMRIGNIRTLTRRIRRA